MAGQTDDAYVMCQVLAPELGSEAYLIYLPQQFLLQIQVAECTSGFVACRGEGIVILDGA